MRYIIIGLLLGCCLSSTACKNEESINQDLNREINIQHQKLKQNKDILLLECADMQKRQKGWQGDVKWESKTNDPLFQEHIKSIQEHGLRLDEHTEDIRSYEKALKKQASVIIQHRKGKVSDEALVDTQRILRQRQLKITQNHDNLRELHQILTEARELIRDADIL